MDVGVRRGPRVRVALAAMVAVILGFGAAESAGSPGTVAGTVTQLGDGALQGAVVTLAGPGQPPLTTTTGADGGFSFQTGGPGPYSVGVQAEGFASRSLGDVQDGASLEFALANASFTPLPVDAGSAEEVEADARSGVFYALMNQAPEVYRTLDYGGSWQSVTMSYDDPLTGLARPAGSDVLTTSSVPGEVAVLSRPGGAFFSTDYGLTWRKVGGDSLPNTSGPPSQFLFWAHAGPGTPNVLLAAQSEADGWDVLRADMSAPSPAFVKEASDPFSPGSVIDVVDSAAGSFIGRVSASGTLSFAPLAVAGPISFGPPEASGVPTPPIILRLGGAEETSAPPDGALVAGGTSPPFDVEMLTKASGASDFGAATSASGTTTGCRFQTNVNPSGSVAPTTTGATGAGNVGQCWLQKNGSDPLTVTEFCCSAFGNVTYDDEWGSGNHVALLGDPAGPHKSARLNPGDVPDFEGGDRVASAGTGPDSGGLSVNGIADAAVADTAYGPTAQKLGVAINGAQLRLGSIDGGQTMALVANRGWGANAVQWWQGASGEWLVFGGLNEEGPEPQLTAALDWDGQSMVAGGGGNVAGSGLGGNVVSLQAVAGTDTLFMGSVTGGFTPSSAGHLYRARLAPGSPPSLADLFSFDAVAGATPVRKPNALAYCPEASSHPNMHDVLFAATGDGGGTISPEGTVGSLLRITGATTDVPTVSAVTSIPHDTPGSVLADVRADCSTGVVYTGGMGGAQLYKSTDGGVTFNALAPIPGPDGGGLNLLITAIGLNPADSNDVTVAAGLGGSRAGTIVHSSDGGQTWTLVNDPDTHRNSAVEDIEFAPGAGSPTILPRPVSRDTAASELALLATGGGAFKADVGAASGIIATGSGAAGLTSQVTTLTADAEPAIAVDAASGRTHGVFRRSNGLAYSAEADGSWSIPETIPGTEAGDERPSMALDRAGGLQLAFRRPGGAAPGIYYMARDAAGSWSAPERVSARLGDVLPSLALAGAATQVAHIAFLRIDGRARGMGVYDAADTGAAWKLKKIPDSGKTDARPTLGGPSLAADPGGKLHLAFPRAGKKKGIYYSSLRGGKWREPQRLTRKTDEQPALAVTTQGTRSIVFLRKGAGLVALKPGKKRWSAAVVPGTAVSDLEPVLTASASGLVLAFARPTGSEPGVYYDQADAGGNWLSAPRRVSGDAADRNPSLGGDGTIVFERG